MAKQTAIVTGAVNELTESICVSLIDRSYHVVSLHPTLTKSVERWRDSLKSHGYDLQLIVADISNRATYAQILEDIEARYDSVDILINCLSQDVLAKSLSAIDWYVNVKEHLSHLFPAMEVAAESMSKGEWGRIVVALPLANDGATQTPMANGSLFKEMLTLAKKYASRGVTINTVSYGGLSDYDAPNTNDRIPRIPTNRLGHPHEVASLVTFLASDDAAFITGMNILVNGGEHLA